MERFKVCDDCAVGLINDDWSHLDWHNASEETAAEISAAVESMGLVSYRGKSTQSGYFDCYTCNDTQCGNGHLFE